MAVHNAFLNLLLDAEDLVHVSPGIDAPDPTSPACPTTVATPFVHAVGQQALSGTLVTSGPNKGTITANVIDFSGSVDAIYGLTAVETAGRNPVIFFEPDFDDGAGDPGGVMHVLRVVGTDTGDGVQSGAEIELTKSGNGAILRVFSVTYNSNGLVSRSEVSISQSLYDVTLSPIPNSIIDSVGFAIDGNGVGVFVEFLDGNGPFHGLDYVAATVSDSRVEFSGEMKLISGAGNWANSSTVRFTKILESNLNDEDDWCGEESAGGGNLLLSTYYDAPFETTPQYSNESTVNKVGGPMPSIPGFLTGPGDEVTSDNIESFLNSLLAEANNVFVSEIQGEQFEVRLDGELAVTFEITGVNPTFIVFDEEFTPQVKQSAAEVQQAIVSGEAVEAGVSFFIPTPVQYHNGQQAAPDPFPPPPFAQGTSIYFENAEQTAGGWVYSAGVSLFVEF